MSNLLIVTRADSNILEMTKLTHPYIKAYAELLGADFKILDKNTPVHRCHYRIMELHDLLEEYDRAI